MTTTAKGEEARSEILNAAWKLFITKGYASTSLRDIAKAAGNRAVGGIYNHFKSKDDLAEQAYEYSVDLIGQAYAEAIKGKYHAVDSKEVAFITAGRKAFVDAVQKASPVLLEPFVHLDITVPADMIGDISSDLSGRRGRIQGTDMLPGNQALIQAEAPLSEVMTYANQLKSITGGAGSYSMEYSHDEPTPANVQQEVIAAFKPQHDDD